MVAPFPIAWEAEDSQRFVGKLTLRQHEIELNGTTTAPSRPRRVVIVQLSHVDDAQLEQVEEWPTVKITTSHTVYEVEILSGGRGAAMTLVAKLLSSRNPRP